MGGHHPKTINTNQIVAKQVRGNIIVGISVIPLNSGRLNYLKKH